LDKKRNRLAPQDGRLGSPAVFLDAAIRICPTIRVMFKLALRQTTGMVASLAILALTVPVGCTGTQVSAFPKRGIVLYQHD
jgi:hypothetical protein